MIPKADIRAEAERLRRLFEDAGATTVEAEVLQPADLLLDLYGEDIRARAYVTHDPIRGEAMLRPDFTVPVVRMHMANGAETARYTYSGEVFRQQPDAAERSPEYLQVGFELFGGKDPASADAEVFALFDRTLRPRGLRAATGDIGLLRAAVLGLETTLPRKAALMRHLWRPRRFRALLDRFGGRRAVPETRAALLAQGDPMAAAGDPIGLRSREEIEARIATLRLDAATPPISAGELALLDDLLSLKGPSGQVLERLRDVAVDMPAIGAAVDRFARRLDALADSGLDAGALEFEASFGRTTLEYYDGFVFGFYAEGRPDLPPVATGGRYDALTRVLGQGREIPAVGGVMRPELLLEIGAAA